MPIRRCARSRIALLLGFLCSIGLGIALPIHAAGNRHMPAENPLSIVYASNNGSLPPPHRRDTRIRIARDGSTLIEHSRGYDASTTVRRKARIDPAQLSALSAWLSESGVWSLPWREQEPRAVGGATHYLELTLGERQLALPIQPVESQRALRDEILRRVLALIPPEPGKPADQQDDPS